MRNSTSLRRYGLPYPPTPAAYESAPADMGSKVDELLLAVSESDRGVKMDEGAAIFEGSSEFKLDKDGLIYEHRLDN